MDEPARWKRGVFQVFLASLAAIAVYSTFPSPLGSRGLAIRRVTPAATVGPLPIAFLTTKAPYAPDLPGMYTKTFNGTLVHVNYLSRHGTRHANKLDTTLALISALASAGERGELTVVGESALSWLRQFVVQESSVLGELSPVGWRELHDVGVRLGEWLNGTLLHAVLGGGQTLRFSSTYKERAIDSRNALMEGLFAALGDELTSQYSISEPTQCDPNGNPIPEFNLLRFFDTCASYVRFTEEEGFASAVATALDAAGFPSAKQLSIWKRDVMLELLSASSAVLADAKFVNKAVGELYSDCRVQFSVFGVANEICSVFHEHSPLLAAFELESDVTEFYEKGAGAGLSYGLACVLLEDMFDEMDTHVSGRTSDGSPLVFGEFRVGHAETISPFIALLGLFPSSPLPQYADYVSGGVSSGRGNLPWAGVGARVSNMAANIGLFLYHLPDDTWHLLVSHSEKNMRFPVCPDSDLCPYHTVKQYYREKVFPAAGFGLCSQHDWSLACNGTVPCDVD